MSVVLCDPSSGTMSGPGSLSTSNEIDHCEELSDNIGALALSDDYNDVTFVVEGREFPAHRVILASRCDYFRALLFGGMRESKGREPIVVHDATADAFELLLKYIYTGKMRLSDIKEAHVIEVLGLANKYGFPSLEKSISVHLRRTLTVANACGVYDVALLYSLQDLQEATAEYIDKNAQQLLTSDIFPHISIETLCSILRRDSFCVPEKIIFKSIQAWCDSNPIAENLDQEEKIAETEKRNMLLAAVRLPLIPLQDLLDTVRPTGLISSDLLLDAIKAQTDECESSLEYRGVLYPDENIATAHHGAQVVQGEMCASLLDGDSRNYDQERGYTRHEINDECNSRKEMCIKVKLGQQSIINCIRMLLWDKDNRSYSYFVEVSVDDKEWIKVIDHSAFLCRSWQELYFPKRVVRYIRVTGTRNSVNRIFHLVTLEAMFSTKQVKLENGLVVAQSNIATLDRCACIIEGVSRDRNALINGDTQNYDWDSGYTCHQLGNGAIVVQLAQPFVFSSIRLLLWDIDDRSYSYYIEVSNDMEEWTTIANKRKEECRAWQLLEFKKVAATFVRIVGTANTANEVFHCVHFECPASNVARVSEPSGSDDEPPTENPVQASDEVNETETCENNNC
uniref:BTB/POZ domain-containing protein 9-like n=1 Tax=Phallusia mammillata TaxID=59560 RepID=A0A6F9D8D3_9ASCI|nr:BTB/POZ domain-containing protein 9-like [Phallusia mammillata]